jgi:two-component system CheB/CheR fusion protein
MRQERRICELANILNVPKPRAAASGKRPAAAKHADSIAVADVLPLAHSVQAIAVAKKVLLDRFAPAAVLVNEKYEALYFCGATERYLAQPRGMPTQDLLMLAGEGLRAVLGSALRQAQTEAVTVADARVKRGTGFDPVKVSVVPLAEPGAAGRLLLVVFEDEPTLPGDAALPGKSDLVQKLQDELRATREDMLDRIELLLASHENLHAVNEQLLVSHAQLESASHELQSHHEALDALNRQLQGRLAELESSYSDLKNSWESSEITTLCLDREFRIKWFTTALRSVFKLIPSDIGRPIGDFAPALSGNGLLQDVEAVLQRLAPVQTELKMKNGQWYLRRTLPYRAGGNEIEGVIITFVDITMIKREAELSIAARKSFTVELERSVEERTRQLRALSFELAMSEEHERRALAQDLHDDLGQLLAVAKIKLVSLLKSCSCTPGELSVLNEVREMVARANKSVHTLAFQLSPPLLDERGLLPIFQWLVEEMRAVYGLQVHMQDDGSVKTVDQQASVIIFRAVREMLINVAKHADVTEAELIINRDGNDIVIMVCDQGKGVDFKSLLARPHDGGFGLVSMRERLSYVGGQVDIASQPGEGTRVTLRMPLQLSEFQAPIL